MDGNNIQTTADTTRPLLWNPDAAANWSLLFTPVFGAYLHAINWRALGKPERAAANIVWLWITVAFLVINGGTLFLPESKTVELVMRLAGLGLLIGWYFSQGRPQAKFVKATYGDNYDRRGWGLPILAGVAGDGVYLTAVLFLAAAAYKTDPIELAAEVQPLILQEWHKQPELRAATIQSLTLVHKGGNSYTGILDAILDGKSERLKLEVTYDGQSIAWELKAPGT